MQKLFLPVIFGIFLGFVLWGLEYVSSVFNETIRPERPVQLLVIDQQATGEYRLEVLGIDFCFW